jgi:hypothetical protein
MLIAQHYEITFYQQGSGAKGNDFKARNDNETFVERYQLK